MNTQITPSPDNKNTAVDAAEQSGLFSALAEKFDRVQFKKLTETLTFPEYLERVYDNPLPCLSAYQRIYDMILSKGVDKFQRYNRTHLRYKFFSDHPTHPIFGLERPLEELVKCIKGAAGYFGTEKRRLKIN